MPKRTHSTPCAVLRDVLLLLGLELPLSTVRRWSPRERAEAQMWAAVVHLATNFEGIAIPEPPVCLRRWVGTAARRSYKAWAIVLDG